MFATLERLPDDPILGLAAIYAADGHPGKVDLSVGVYKDERGRVPIMEAVRQAEAVCLEKQESKSYIGVAGEAAFNEEAEKLIFGPMRAKLGTRLRTVQTPGSCAALYAAAMLVRQSNPTATVWVSNPTWANHVPLFRSVGLSVEQYPYYNRARYGIDFDAMMAALGQARAGDVVLVHGCCHNPSGADLAPDQWRALTDLVLKKGLLPLVDLAYQGFARDADADAEGLRHMALSVPELLVTMSCSKNFGLYRDRTGCLSLLATTPSSADAAFSHVLKIARCSYSMPPAHGAAVVRTILTTPELYAKWVGELDGMRKRITAMRQGLVKALAERIDCNFDYLETQSGMFSFIDLEPEQILQLRRDRGIYILESGRMNVCGLNTGNINTVADAIAAVAGEGS